MEELDFPCEAIEQLTEKFAELTASPVAKEKLHEAYDCLFGYKEGDYMALAKEMSEITGIHDHTVEMLLLLGAADILRYVYNAKGLPDKVWRDSMCDLRYKLFEYKKLSGLWGTNVGWWYKDFYTLKRFALGRLQFNKGRLKVNCGDLYKEGDTVLYCHIPSSGPLDIEEAKESFRMAREWFKNDFKDGIVPLACSSWLLYPDMTEKLPDKSNIKKFAALFDIYSSFADPANNNFWRVFYRDYSPEIMDEIKPASTLERVIVDMIKCGGSLGYGVGLIKDGILD